MIGDIFMDYSLNGRIAACDGNRHPEMAPHGVFRCAGGDWISIAVSSDAAWQVLAGMLRLKSDSRYATLAERKVNEDALEQLISDWTKDQDAKVLAAQLQAAGIAAAKSANSIDLISDEHLWAREFYRHVTDASGESRAIVGPAWRMSNAAAITDGSPRLGQHNAYVFGEIMGLSPAEQERLTKAGITR